MLERLIESSVRNRFLVAFVSVLICAWGVWALLNIKLNAVPDMSDVQVIVYTPFVGQPPQVVEDQVTYPLVHALLSAANVKVVRGFSFFNFSLVFVVFHDGTDFYWARSRVLEYLNYAAAQLPPGIQPQLGPDSTGVGWVFEYVLEDPTGHYDLQQLRSYQDWHLKYELATVQGVAEVASLGGFVKQYQVDVDPRKLIAYKLSLAQVKRAIKASNNDVGGRVLERGGQEYRITALGYIHSLDDIRSIVLGVGPDGAPIYVRDVANVHLGPELRRGVADLDGRGEAVVGIVEMRAGDNALATIRRVKARLKEVERDLPPGLKIVPIYDRSGLIEQSVETLRHKLIEECLIVVVVIAVFLLNFGAATVAVLTIPVGVLLAAIVMYYAGVSADIMSLAGVAVAIGAMVDAAVVMVENGHRYLAEGKLEHDRAIIKAATEVGPALFFSLLIITLSFIPVFALHAQAGRLFKPLAFTKTVCMAAAALLSVTLTPALMSYLMTRGGALTHRDIAHEGNLLDRAIQGAYRPLLRWAMANRAAVGVLFVALLVSTVIPWSRIGMEFLPSVFEGDLVYAPTAYPGISITQSKLLLQRADRILMTFPEVEHVLGKMGRAETATDSVSLYMGEILIKLKPRDQWPPGTTPDRLVEQMDRALHFPGIINAWSMPIKERVDNVNTGVKTTLGIKLLGDDLERLEQIGRRIEETLRPLPGTRSVLSDRVYEANYINFHVEREEAARYGLTVEDVEDAVQLAIGGLNVTTTVEGQERYPVNIRYPRELRSSPGTLGRVILYTKSGEQVPLGQVTRMESVEGPTAVKTEGGELTDWIYIDLQPGVDIGSYVRQARRALNSITLPRGYSMVWSGEYIYLQDAVRTLAYVTPIALIITFVVLFLNFRSVAESLIVMLCVPFGASGGVWAMYLLGYNMSIAAWMGMLVLVGFAVEGGVVMLIYIINALRDAAEAKGARLTPEEIEVELQHAAVDRMRPRVMVLALLTLGLLPIFWGEGAGASLMRTIAAPVVGGMISTVAVIFLLLPPLYAWWRVRVARRVARHIGAEPV
ncbi:MAG TPA: CusA/CzcA family heavy metal efflux RND transporter [Candidatus Binataceae bacterium]|jgi:Cu(I)/Ag(I) efflux system membrane protein CusA/SilA|nr:CusA/CzcA family heavy metal efflux RND transporter [Candidatus Binataceae bacterium]